MNSPAYAEELTGLLFGKRVISPILFLLCVVLLIRIGLPCGRQRNHLLVVLYEMTMLGWMRSIIGSCGRHDWGQDSFRGSLFLRLWELADTIKSQDLR